MKISCDVVPRIIELVLLSDTQAREIMTVHILDIPVEILLMIFSRLPSQTLIFQLPLVCKHFRDILATTWYWKTRYVRLAGSRPLKEREILKEWQEGCIQSEFSLSAAKKELTLTSLSG